MIFQFRVDMFLRLNNEKITSDFIMCVDCDISSNIYDVNIINFCRPHTRVFYFFAQKKGHHLAAPLLISRCEENFICPVL